MVKPYYCPKCGKSYTQKECLENHGKMYCYDCPNVKVLISGTPLMLIGLFLGVMYLAVYYFYKGHVSQYLTYIFLPSCAGMIFLGLVRNNNASRAASKASCAKPGSEAEEKQGPIKKAACGCCKEEEKTCDKAEQEIQA